MSTAPESFQIPAAPDLIPEGPWKKVPGGVCAAKGFKATGVYAGLRASGKKGDLALVVADAPATAAGAFTTNVMCAAPVTFCKEVLAKRPAVRAVRARALPALFARITLGFRSRMNTMMRAIRTVVGASNELLWRDGMQGMCFQPTRRLGQSVQQVKQPSHAGKTLAQHY